MAKRIIAAVVAAILVIGISVGTTLIVDKNAVPVSMSVSCKASEYSTCFPLLYYLYLRL